MGVKNLKAGSYIVTFSNAGYDTLSAEILVSASGVTCVKVDAGGSCGSTTPPGVNMISAWSVLGTLKLKEAPPPPKKGYLSVASTPVGASVDVNGVDIGKTPVSAYELDAGDKVVTLRLSGYEPSENAVKIVADETATLDVTLTPIAVEEEGFLSVTSSPSGANVAVGGANIGSTPIDKYGLKVGPKTVTISLAGYKPAKEEVTIAAGETATVSVTLEEEEVPTDICGWIDEVGVGSLTRDYWLYVYSLTIGAAEMAELYYEGLSPKPSRLDPLLATRDNWLALYSYSIGAIEMGNTYSGCSY